MGTIFKWIGIFVVAFIVFGLYVGKKASDDATSVDATTPRESSMLKKLVDRNQAMKPETATDAQQQAALKAEEDEKKRAAMEISELELETQLACEKAVRKKLNIPKSADFSWLSSRFSVSEKTGRFTHYNTFEYRNAFNAELEGAYLCQVETKNFDSTKTVKVVDISLDVPSESANRGLA